ncbi:MAG TPA: sodium:solute symporter [Saprospiraceae bacterium]|nr:sodium:solute symporter [Saprospiraceae bacterium]HPG06474.1 sodium:solute symporter [Saprospiraceae bacterium]HQU53391.1 sodium:solute symporter [Saprospiraceae bacterium]HRV83998.1 sodium:solute symporter [Saprospiraceae bacterium]
MESSFETLDWVVLGLYFAVLFGIAIWVILQKNKDTEDYFLAGRNIGWFVVGASIFASNIGSEHVVGLAGTGASNKMPLLIYELHAWVVLMLGWVFLPFYQRAGVFTMPEFLEKRFSPNTRWFLSIFSLIAYVLTKVSVTVYAGGIVISTLLHIDFWAGALSTVILTGIYTVLGGMRAVVYTEAVQTIILILGAGLLTILGLQAVGGWGALKAQVGPSYFDMWRSASDPDYPWPSLVITSSVVGIWYWCTDQYIVQRALTAKNITEGRRGTIWGGFLKLMPVFIFLIPGVIALALKQQGVLNWDTPDQAFPSLMTYIMPAGLRGLVAAGLLAALMSSLASVFNSCSTLFTVDIYQKLNPDAPQKKLVSVGRYATILVVIAGILWIPIMQNISGVLYEYLQSVQSYIAPPITSVFLLGIFWKRINKRGAMATLVSGLVIGVIRISLELSKNHFEPGSILHTLGNMNFLTFAAWFFLVSILITIVVSLLSEVPSYEKLRGLTFGTLTKEQREENRNSYHLGDVVASVLVVGIVVFVMSSFNG